MKWTSSRRGRAAKSDHVGYLADVEGPKPVQASTGHLTLYTSGLAFSPGRVGSSREESRHLATIAIRLPIFTRADPANYSERSLAPGPGGCASQTGYLGFHSGGLPGHNYLDSSSRLRCTVLRRLPQQRPAPRQSSPRAGGRSLSSDAVTKLRPHLSLQAHLRQL